MARSKAVQTVQPELEPKMHTKPGQANQQANETDNQSTNLQGQSNETQEEQAFWTLREAGGQEAEWSEAAQAFAIITLVPSNNLWND